MKLFLYMVFLCFATGCRAQSARHQDYMSFTGRYYDMGESPFPIYRTTSIDISGDKDSATLLLNTGKETIWPLKFSSELEVGEDGKKQIVDTYTTSPVAGLPILVRLIYQDNALIEVVFYQGFFSYHFFITYPLSI